MNRSRQKIYLTGMNELSEIDNIGKNTNYQGYQKYQNAYQGGMNGSVLLNQPNYTNPNNTIHNNIGNNVLLEQTFDNKIFIDTSFCDHSKNCDPFKFTVKFNGRHAKINYISATVVTEISNNINNMNNIDNKNNIYIDNKHKIYVNKDSNTFVYSKYLEGDSDIVFDRIFKNIKFVNVDALIMPDCITYKTNEDGSYSQCGHKLAKTKYKYLILKINELRNGRNYSNNPALGKESFIMKMDSDICLYNQIWIPIHKNVSYFDSQLKLIEKLNVEICDDKGVRLCTKLDGHCFDFFTDYRNTIDKVLHLQQLNTFDANEQIQQLLPKLKSLKNITESISPELHLTFNTLESQINTK